VTEDFLERMHMADQDDDDADLKQLKQLRQIWLAMPEEEPPTRGLDALMAAARSQAAAMEPKPSWWKRMLAQLVRPPALALATIVVVAGGSAAPSDRRDEGIASGGEGKAASQDHSPDVQPHVADKAPVATAKPATQPGRPPTPKKPPPAKEDRLEHRPVEGNDVEVATPKDIVLSERGRTDPTHATPTSPPPPPPPHADPTPRGGVTKVGGAQLATDSQDTTKAESIDSLMRRAREAARRGDCATTKTLAAQIGKLDLGYYRDTVLKDAAVVKCL